MQLLRANERHVWGQTYERPAADLFRVQGEISGMVADAIKLSLTPAERKSLTAAPAVQVQAQDAFLRGLQRLNDQRPESLRAALADLQEAVRLDPTSARAFATLSQCYLLAGTRDIMTRDESYAKALAAATRALQLDDTVAQAHTQLAEVKFYFEWDWQAARRGYERALELNPNNSHALARYSLFLSALDEQDAALKYATLAQAAGPDFADCAVRAGHGPVLCETLRRGHRRVPSPQRDPAVLARRPAITSGWGAPTRRGAGSTTRFRRSRWRSSWEAADRVDGGDRAASTPRPATGPKRSGCWAS